jgi:hypothetical protein
VSSPSRIAWFLAITAFWAAFVWPYVAVGPNDLEDFYMGPVSTKIAVDALLAGDWPFWSLDIGLGVPQPVKFHFITYPLSPLCSVMDCGRVLKLAAIIQITLGSLCLGAILRASGVGRTLATTAGLAFLLASSTVQFTYVDDWSSVAVNTGSVPILIFAAFKLFRATDSRSRLLYSLMLGGMSGLQLSMGYPLPHFLVVVPFLFAQPRRLWEQWRWLAFATAIGLLIGGGHLYHLAEQVLATPASVPRTSHIDAPLASHAWSAFLRPFGPDDLDRRWRVISFGPPFALLALASFMRRRPEWRAYKAGLIGTLLLMVLPEQWLFNTITDRWMYAVGVHVFGILLATLLVHDLQSRLASRRTATLVVAMVVAVQVGWQWLGVYPVWRPVALVAAGAPEPDPIVRRLAHDQPAVERLKSLVRKSPGRLMLSLDADQTVRGLSLARYGLAQNVFPPNGVPTVNAAVLGIVLDDLYPTPELTGGPLIPPADAHLDRAFLDALGVRYVLVKDGQDYAPGLNDLGTVPRGLRLLENAAAWPEAFFVSALPPLVVPRKAGCGHDRFLCADFSRYDVARTSTPVAVERHHDGMTLTFPPADQSRSVIVNQWYRPGWHTSAGRVTSGMEQFIAVEVPAGIPSVRLTYFPLIRGILFLTGIAAETLVLAAIAGLVIARRKAVYARPGI